MLKIPDDQIANRVGVLYRAVQYAHMDWLRVWAGEGARKTMVKQIPDDDEYRAPSTDMGSAVEERDRVVRALSECTEAQAAAVLLGAAGYRAWEIAELLGSTEASVWSQQYQARRAVAASGKERP